jgi:ParB family chromosome partitioning protein
VESVESKGVLVPILARPAQEGKHEILSGHNRVEALKILGRKTAPVIVREGIDDEEALWIVVETNLIQRSFSDFAPSERAATIAIHHDSLKNQGRRTDLIKEVEELFETYMGAKPSTSGAVHQKLGSREQIGRNFGLSSSVVAYYLRINKLIPQHKSRLDSGAMSIRAAVSLSFLSADEQELVDEILTTDRYRLSLEEAETLRDIPKPLTPEAIRKVVRDQKRTSGSIPSILLQSEFLSQYFEAGQSRDEIQKTIATALRQYFESGKG